MKKVLQASILGAILSLIVSTIMGSQESTGGLLAVHELDLFPQEIFWSWPVFFGGTALAWAILLSMA